MRRAHMLLKPQLWTWLCWAAMSTSALAAPSWPAVVDTVASPFALHTTPSELDPELAALCADGIAGACALRSERPGPVFGAACAQGDDDACLGAAWLGTVDDRQAFRAFVTHCEQGHAAACASAAEARMAGRGTWGSTLRGRRAAESLCAAEKAEGCFLLAAVVGPDRPEARRRHLEQAQAFGSELAPFLIAAMDGPEARTRSLHEACAAGHGASCMKVVGSLAPEEQPAIVDRACQLGDSDGCLATTVLAVERGTLTVAAALRQLDTACAQGHLAPCFGARAYRNGGRPLPWSEGRLPPGRTREILLPHNREIGDCHRAHIEQGGDLVLDVDLTVDFDTDGVLLAVVGKQPDEELERCIADALTGYDSLGPAGGPTRAALRGQSTIGASYLAGVPAGDLDARNELVDALNRVARIGPERCYIDGGGSPFDEQFLRVAATLAPDGTLTLGDLVESSGDAPTDACVFEQLDGFVTPGRRPSYTTRFDLHLDFNAVTMDPDESVEKSTFRGAVSSPRTESPH